MIYQTFLKKLLKLDENGMIRIAEVKPGDILIENYSKRKSDPYQKRNCFVPGESR
jgi:DNA-directed RNA polymerase beta subunit